MGLNIVVRVKRQREEYMSYGCNPKGTKEEIEAQLYAELLEKFPKAEGEFALTVYANTEEFDFDIRFGHYADGFNKAGYEEQEVYLALLDFVLAHFSADYGIDIHVYHAP